MCAKIEAFSTILQRFRACMRTALTADLAQTNVKSALERDKPNTAAMYS